MTTPTCKHCGYPLTIQTQPALIAGRADTQLVHCLDNPDCVLHYVTVCSIEAQHALDVNQFIRIHEHVFGGGE